jgi:nicotinamide-nucleotide amidase
MAAPGDEPGLVHLACARRGRQPAHCELHLGPQGRAKVRLEAVRKAVAMMQAALD